MRGTDQRSGKLFSYIDLEQRVPARHPLRAIRGLVNEALANIGPELEAVYSRIGRPSIAPERLLRTLLLQLFHGIRSERQIMERLDFDLSFRWFVGLGIDDPVSDASTFSKNRERLLDGKIAARFLSAILARPQVKRLLSAEHFSVDGTLIEAWCSMKSFRPKDGAGTDAPADGPGGRNGEVDFRGTRRSNETHASTTDPGARLYRKSPGVGARLCYMGHVLMGERTLRRLLIIGASAVVLQVSKRGAPVGSWLEGMLARKPRMLVTVALANKMARTVWALLVKQEDYRAPVAAAA